MPARDEANGIEVVAVGSAQRFAAVLRLLEVVQHVVNGLEATLARCMTSAGFALDDCSMISDGFKPPP